MATYVTKEDYLNKFGVDLDLELSPISYFEGVGSPASSFLNEIEDICLLRLSKYDFPASLSDYQKKQLKNGILYQAKYVLQEGDLFNQSGIQENGAVIDISKLAFSPIATEYFRNCGLMNLRMC